MLRALRRSRLLSTIALAAVVGLAPASFSPIVHRDGDDILRQPAVVVHDHDAHRIGAGPLRHDDSRDCLICRLLRLQRVVESTARLSPPQPRDLAVPAASAAAPAGSAAARVPARAPPLV